MSDPSIILKHLDAVLGDCVDIATFGGHPDDPNLFFDLTMKKIREIFDKCYDMKFRIFQEMEDDLKATQYPD